MPIFDTTFVTVARTLAGRPISMGGRDHTSHRLVALGLSERAAVLLLYLVAVAAGAIAFVSLSDRAVADGGADRLLRHRAGAVRRLPRPRSQVYPADQERRPAGPGVVRLISDFTYTRQVGTVCIDAVLVVLAYYTAYLLRFEGRLDAEVPAFVQSLPVVLVCQLAAFALFRVYQGMWRYTSVGDFIRLAQAATVGTRRRRRRAAVPHPVRRLLAGRLRHRLAAARHVGRGGAALVPRPRRDASAGSAPTAAGAC